MTDILLATYNGGAFLQEQLDSLYAQTDKEFHIIARDDGSTDDTKEILLRNKEDHPGMLSILPDGESTGNARDNFFCLLDESTAGYVMFCDQDDRWADTKIERTKSLMLESERKFGADTPLLVHTDLIVTDNAMDLIDMSLFHMQRLESSFNTLNRMVAQNNITGCTVMINRKLKEMVRRGDNALMHDWWLGLIAAAFGHIVFLPESTVFYRQHDENEVGAKDVRSGEYFRSKLADREGIKKLLADTYVQAHEFLTVYGDLLSEGQQAMLKEYINLHYYNFGKRFSTMMKYKFFKSGLLRKLGQLVFG